VERSSSDEQARAEFKAELNDFLGDVLREANVRDAEATNRHLDTVRRALENLLEESIELRFGGSVIKHTYVDGISDVDLLAVVSRDTAVDANPQQLIGDFATAIRDRLPNTGVEVGQMSVKVRFEDGTELQILPAFKVGDGYRLPRQRGDSWSGVVRPRDFASRLTAVNESNSGKVVPIIKLFKIAQERLPENSRLTGYHVEAIAVKAFQDYRGSLDRGEMLLHLARIAGQTTTRPLEETTGQSTYVDGYLGPEGSTDRLRTSAAIQRLATKLERATERNQLEPWREVFSE
jgi:hypothetical protein